MKILIACERSQAVTIEMRLLGIDAYSCDIKESYGGFPEYHIQEDVELLLDLEWDMIIAFPPCTNIARSGGRWFKDKREDGRQQRSIDFFMKFTNLKCPRVAIENPIGIMSSIYRKPDQIIQPWMFGHPESKRTCLWLKNLPKLIETKNVKSTFEELPKKQRNRIHYLSNVFDRSKIRSKTFIGVAKAMAMQWGTLVLK